MEILIPSLCVVVRGLHLTLPIHKKKLHGCLQLLSAFPSCYEITEKNKAVHIPGKAKLKSFKTSTY